MLRLGIALSAVLAVLLALTPGAPAQAADPTALGLSAPSGFDGTTAPLAVALTASDGTPLVGATVRVERRVSGEWRLVASPVTDEAGAATVRVTRLRKPGNNLFRASYDGDATHDPATTTTQAALRRRPGVVTLVGPGRVVDERSVTLRVTSRAGSGDPVAGRVRIERSVQGRPWRRAAVLDAGPKGLARITVTPRRDTRWRAVTTAQTWVTGGRSKVLRVDNVPQTAPVRLPRAAPEPRVQVPHQRRATAPGAAARITTIPDGVWRNMVGRSWHSGCPVGRDGLRLLRINYWGYDGYRYRGEIVAAAWAIDNMSRALTAMYDARLPIRSMYRVDRFGWSPRLRGADDYRSMAAGNTSAFNCRDVVNRPGVRSPHSYGGALDVNTWENPYRSATGLVPNTWWASRSDPRVAWRSREHRVVRIMLRAGFRWTYGTGDSQHFDATGGSARVVAPSARTCGGVCH